MKKTLLTLIILLFLFFPVIRPLITAGYFPMHDNTQVERVVEMGKALRNGQFPVRWVSELGYGYGYPIFNFYGPLPYYVGGIFYALGLSGLLATKIMMGIGMIGAGLTMYWLISHNKGRLAGILSAVVYVYAPYHAVQLYVRGAIGELWVLVFLPLIIFSLYKIVEEKKYSSAILIGAIGFAGTMLSHTILGYTTLFFSAVVIAVFAGISLVTKHIKTVQILILTLITGLALSCFFWLPAFTEMKYTAVSDQIGPTARVTDHFVCPSQFWYSPWGYGGSVAGCTDGISFALGKINIVFILIGIIILLIRWKKINQRYNSISILMAIGLSLFFMTSASSFLWNILPGFSYVQYPWRFLVYTYTGIALISAGCVATFSSKIVRIFIAVISVGVVIYMNMKLFSPQYIYNPSPSMYESDEDIMYRASKISDEYLPKEIIRPQKPSDVSSKLIPDDTSYIYKFIVDKESYKKIEFNTTREIQLQLHQAYFPGWKYWVNSKEQPHLLKDGMPIVTLPSEFSTLEMKFTDTPARVLGNAISLISVVVLGYYYGKKTFR